MRHLLLVAAFAMLGAVACTPEPGLTPPADGSCLAMADNGGSILISGHSGTVPDVWWEGASHWRIFYGSADCTGDDSAAWNAPIIWATSTESAQQRCDDLETDRQVQSMEPLIGANFVNMYLCAPVF